MIFRGIRTKVDSGRCGLTVSGRYGCYQACFDEGFQDWVCKDLCKDVSKGEQKPLAPFYGYLNLRRVQTNQGSLVLFPARGALIVLHRIAVVAGVITVTGTIAETKHGMPKKRPYEVVVESDPCPINVLPYEPYPTDYVGPISITKPKYWPDTFPICVPKLNPNGKQAIISSIRGLKGWKRCMYQCGTWEVTALVPNSWPCPTPQGNFIPRPYGP